jgi:hypothetical protein
MTIGRKVSTWAPLLLVVLATPGAAALSIVTAPASTASLSAGPPPNGPRLWHSAIPGPIVPGPDGNRPAAVTEAHRLLGLVAVPSAWAPVSTLPVKSLEAPAYAPDTPDLVDLYQYWTTHGTRQAVQSWVNAHRPVGSRLADSGYLSDGTIISSSVADAFPTTGNRFRSRQIVFAVAPMTSGRVGIRIDVQIIWYPTRSRAELVPADDSTVVATVFQRGSLSNDSIIVLAKATFTSPSIVKRLADRVDTLPLALPGVHSCPADRGTEPQLQLVFSGGLGGPTITVHDDPDGCGTVTFTRGTTEESALTDDGLLREVEKLLRLNPSATASS